MSNMKYILTFVLLFVVGQCVAAENGTEKKQMRRTSLSSIKPAEMIVYKSKDPKAVITIYTDLDCGYCRKLHYEIPKLNDLGVEVRYLAFPRHGIGSTAYNTMVGIWCSENPHEAMTHAMEGQEVAYKTCKHSIEKQYDLGLEMGVSGTPTIIFADGAMWGGYLSAERLAREAIKHSGS